MTDALVADGGAVRALAELLGEAHGFRHLIVSRVGERIRLPVRLRYRVREGKLAWFFALYRPDAFITERIRADLARVAAATGLPCFEGTPEA